MDQLVNGEHVVMRVRHCSTGGRTQNEEDDGIFQLPRTIAGYTCCPNLWAVSPALSEGGTMLYTVLHHNHQILETVLRKVDR